MNPQSKNSQSTIAQKAMLATGLVALTCSLSLLQGCAGVEVSTGSPAAPVVPAGASMHGGVFGGQQPVSGATIQIYAANMTAAKGPATATILTTVQTDANGVFTVPGYSCPANTLLYITATGGDSGAGVNTGLVLLAALGPCSSLTPSTNININELTTVAGVYALAPFMANATHTGSTATSATGLANAFNTANLLASYPAGSVPGPNLPSNVTAPTAKLISLADAMAACVNSASGSSQCNTFYAAATPPAGSAPSDTVTALLNIAHYPANNVAAIFGLIDANAPFQTALATASSDWTMPLTISGGGLTAPYALAVDASGNVWAANEAGFDISKFNYLGAAISGNSGYTGGGLLAPQGIAIDLSGNAWVANTGGSTVVKLDPTGAVLSSTGFTDGGVNAPTAIAVVKTGNAWVANFAGDSITELAPTGGALNGNPIASATGSAPVSLNLDSAGNIWVDNTGTGTVSKYSGVGAAAAGSPYTDGFLQGGAQLALTSAANAWVAAPGNNTLSAFAANGSALPVSPVSGGGLNLPTGVAIDGSNVVWVANAAASGTLSAFTSTGAVLSPAIGLGALNAPTGVAIDASGNVWAANSGADVLTEFVGLASPVLTPLAANLN